MKLRRASYVSPGEPGKRGFQDLDCFKMALDIVVNVHDFAKTLPASERYDLASQIRRAAKSITANIAEGYGRYHYLESLKFYSIARGSLNETLGHLINALVIGCCDQEYFNEFYGLIRQTERALNGYMSYVRKQRAGEGGSRSRTIGEATGEYEALE